MVNSHARNCNVIRWKIGWYQVYYKEPFSWIASDKEEEKYTFVTFMRFDSRIRSRIWPISLFQPKQDFSEKRHYTRREVFELVTPLDKAKMQTPSHSINCRL